MGKTESQGKKPKISKLAVASIVVAGLGLLCESISGIFIGLINFLPLWTRSSNSINPTGLIIGGLGLIAILLGLVGGVIGALALFQIRRSNGRLIGKTAALFGLIMGFIPSFISIGLICLIMLCVFLTGTH